MKYFDNDFISFFEELTLNNNKEWFDQNRKRYETIVKNPFKKFTEDFIIELRSFDDSIDMEAKDAIFRINRDIRFSKDKQPYKTHVAAAAAKGGKKSHYPGYYLQISAKEVWVGGGSYFLEKEHIEKIRQEIYYNPKEFTSIINQTDFVKSFGKIDGDRNKRINAPYAELLDEIPEIANKQFYFMNSISSKTILEDDFMKKIIAKLKTSLAFNQFIHKALEE